MPKRQLIGMFNTFPEAIEYDHFEHPHLDALLNSSVFGGSILQPVSKDLMSKREIFNSVGEIVSNLDINLLEGGGFY